MLGKTTARMLHALSPETAHDLTVEVFGRIARTPLISSSIRRDLLVKDPKLSQELFGDALKKPIHFRNSIGLAAGYDKRIKFIAGADVIGFGFTEVGGITLLPQNGNPKPRLWRHAEERSLQNFMGLNNPGIAQAMSKLPINQTGARRHSIPIGVNLGKGKNTPNEEAVSEYHALMRGMHSRVDYMTINVSSPNTKGLRDLQSERTIQEIFSLTNSFTTPVMLKISPDIDASKAIYLCKAAVDCGAKGIIATNTTTDYSLLRNPKSVGGISGAALREKSTKVFAVIAKELFGKCVLIYSGGVSSSADAIERHRMGASLIQIFTALVYEGAEVVKKINRGISDTIRREHCKDITELIGSRLG
ncbi:MAG: quinone-dependent dihydroorotate dehydrogenase [Candidatus Micrarchaeota archaeon]|nr:quinone-dependent dihydroorotate dehydrogenase [Candidatus Micrarchaeota archaeon]MDE1847915.1 quinone-dependent dihydroorotate dehydrogenase [Candidatus Micrarchaeota archaeon]MDE1864965.1 quinone-dependent dihydroorotate dehydrogenase [Candidatus Micrarchaeota archaeon]